MLSTANLISIICKTDLLVILLIERDHHMEVGEHGYWEEK